ncbi:MAG: hypothetical protein LBW85_00020 [Deltaproteobacteria bacterium]|jgi:hypothetical protein|nr:hypothetical protein [Deltaproteobacteria bacterium]
MGFAYFLSVNTVKDRYISKKQDALQFDRDRIIAGYFLTSSERHGTLSGLINELNQRQAGLADFFEQEREALLELDGRLARRYPWLKEAVESAYGWENAGEHLAKVAFPGGRALPARPGTRAEESWEEAYKALPYRECPEGIRLAFDRIQDDVCLLDSYLSHLTGLCLECLRQAGEKQNEAARQKKPRFQGNYA